MVRTLLEKYIKTSKSRVKLSSLLLAILGEITVSEGSLCVSGSLSYAAQEPWVFQGTILENIVFGQKFDSNRYNEVIRVCALERDISMFPDGHSTTVGERGVMLSGGQKARVGLARAVYQKADAYLFDDPLSAVDVSVGELIFNDCIKGFLREKTVILVTHQIQILGSVERIVWLENGSVKDVGSYMDIIGTGYETGEGDQDEENDISCVNAEENICSKANNSHNNKISMESENKMFQAVGGTVMIYLKSGGSWWSIALLFFLYFSTQISGSFFDIWLNRWVNLEDHVHKAESELNAKGKIRNIPDTLTIALPPLLDVPTETCLIVLGISLMTLIILAVFSTFYVSHFLTRASSTLHNNMFDAVLRTAVGFFNNNTSGRILNRFSYELRIVDELLSDLLMESLTITLFLAGTFVLVAIINPLVIILIVVCFSAILYLKRVYVKTSSQLRRLESASRSPVFAHINQTLNGLTTVRAFGAQHYLTSEFYKYQDDNSGAQFLFTGLSLIFGYWVELISLVYSAGAIFGLFILRIVWIILLTELYEFITVGLMVPSGSSMVAGNAGMVVTQIVAMSSLFQHVLKVIVEFENSLTSVERVFEYSKLPSEDNWKAPEGVSGDADGSTWPEHGKIQFKSVSFRHQAHGPRVLEDLNITIMPREKIGIVGRTGAGKSSMISALLRMAVVEGRIEIDDIDSSTVPLQILRSNISIIPQEPILFSGPLRRNIDPFEKYTDDIIWTALEEVELREVVSHLPNGLNFEISEGGENLSVGQKQLLCLARAIVRNNKILILDEATANVDHETDTLIQRTIRRKFMDKTVLTIAHRLNTVIDSDRVLVISHGNVVEFDHPHELLQNEIGHFREMVAKCGKSTENLLRKIAEEKEKWSFMRGWILPEDPRPRRDWNDFTNDTYQAYI